MPHPSNIKLSSPGGNYVCLAPSKAQKNNPKTTTTKETIQSMQEKTSTCCCSCSDKFWRPICNFFAAIWNLFRGTSKTPLSEKQEKTETLLIKPAEQIPFEPFAADTTYSFPSEKELYNHLTGHSKFQEFAPLLKEEIEKIVQSFVSQNLCGNLIKPRIKEQVSKIFRDFHYKCSIFGEPYVETDGVNEQTDYLEIMLKECATPLPINP